MLWSLPNKVCEFAADVLPLTDQEEEEDEDSLPTIRETDEYGNNSE